MTAPPDAGCGVCALRDGAALYRDRLWTVRHIEPPWGVAGWLLVIANRHVASPADFDDDEAASLGPILRRCQGALREVTGALRIYTASLGEQHPHFHAHLVPRLATMPLAAVGFAVFDLQRAAAAGEVAVDGAEVAGISAAFASRMAAAP